jgi:ABC-type molybdate transport system ATPase subunit
MLPIRHNIRCEILKQLLIEAARVVQIHDRIYHSEGIPLTDMFISHISLFVLRPKLVRERIETSGGEKQRVAIARTTLRTVYYA